MKTIYKTFIALGIFTLFINSAFSQDTNVVAVDTNAIVLPTDGPKRLTFESGLLFDQQTVQMQPSKTLEFVLYHRFGSLENGVTDLWGIYGAANISFGLNYNLTDYLMVGFNTVKYNKLQNFQYKLKLLSETKSGSIPVSVVWYGNVVIDGRDETTFGTDYKFTSRLSYFNQLLIAKKFTEGFSLQLAPSFTHYNMVDTVSDHDKFALSVLARYKFTPQLSVVVGYDHPFYIQSLSEHADLAFKAKPNLTFGIEIATSTHAFHIFAGTANNIVPQEIMMKNANDYKELEFLIGFNMTRLWNF
jgi:hypothetical protein